MCTENNIQESSAAGYQLRRTYVKNLLMLECHETGQDPEELKAFAESSKKQKYKKKDKEEKALTSKAAKKREKEKAKEAAAAAAANASNSAQQGASGSSGQQQHPGFHSITGKLLHL